MTQKGTVAGRPAQTKEEPMEIVEQREQSAAVPFVLVLAIVATLLIGLAALALARPAGAPARPPSPAVTSSTLSPDAQDRNAEILADRLDKAEATHGH